MNANLHNFLMKNKGPAILIFSNKGKKYYKLKYNNFEDVEEMFEKLLNADLDISSKVIGKTLYIWE